MFERSLQASMLTSDPASCSLFPVLNVLSNQRLTQIPSLSARISASPHLIPPTLPRVLVLRPRAVESHMDFVPEPEGVLFVFIPPKDTCADTNFAKVLCLHHLLSSPQHHCLSHHPTITQTHTQVNQFQASLPQKHPHITVTYASPNCAAKCARSREVYTADLKLFTTQGGYTNWKMMGA